MRSKIYSRNGYFTFATCDEEVTIEDILPTLREIAKSPVEVKRCFRERLEELGLVTPLTYLREEKFLELVAQTVLNGTFRSLNSPKLHVTGAQVSEAFAPPSKKPMGPGEPNVQGSAPTWSGKAGTQAEALRVAAERGGAFCQKCKNPIELKEKSTSKKTNQSMYIKEEGQLLCENCKIRKLGKTVFYASEDALWSASYLNKNGVCPTCPNGKPIAL